VCFRGWFQSSLLTAAACTGGAPYKAIVTHGFTLDENMRKMSKSVGNVISPQEIINGSTGPGKKAFPTPFGADVLRYWVASTDFATDVAVGPSIMTSVSESLRKIRNTARFLLGSLHDLSSAEKASLIFVCDAPRNETADALVQLWSKSPRQLWERDGLEGLTPLDR
jgi:isoleucyl-tRNA synthetase